MRQAAAFGMRSLAIGFSTVVLLAAGVGCKSAARAPNTNQPEDKLLFDWGQTLAAGDRDAALKLYDLEVRQKLEFWDKTLKPIKNPVRQAELLAAALPRIGEAAALGTVGQEAWDEVKSEPWIQELAEGKCVSGAPSKDDIGRGVVPKERSEMGQDLGGWVFTLRTTLNWAPAFRVQCPKSKASFWVQLAQRKRTDPNADAPLRVVRVGK